MLPGSDKKEQAHKMLNKPLAPFARTTKNETVLKDLKEGEPRRYSKKDTIFGSSPPMF